MNIVIFEAIYISIVQFYDIISDILTNVIVNL